MIYFPSKQSVLMGFFFVLFFVFCLVIVSPFSGFSPQRKAWCASMQCDGEGWCSVGCCWAELMCEGWHALVASFTLSLLIGWLHSKRMRQARILYTAGGEWVVSVCSVDLSSWVCEWGSEDYLEAYIGLKS